LGLLPEFEARYFWTALLVENSRRTWTKINLPNHCEIDRSAAADWRLHDRRLGVEHGEQRFDPSKRLRSPPPAEPWASMANTGVW